MKKPNFSQFLELCFQTVDPGTEFLPNWHIDLIGQYLDAVNNGDITRLIINMPPRSCKSICTSVAWPAWLLANDPTRRIIVSCYSQILSKRHSLDCRLVLQSDWYQELYPHVCLSKDQNDQAKFVTTERGFRFATSVGGTVTGEGGNFLIVDDPHNPMHLESKAQREHALNWFDQSFATRLNDKKKGVIVVVMQRLHNLDLTGHLLNKPNNQWEMLKLPAIVEEKTVHKLGDFEKIRLEGDILHPEREGKEELDAVKVELGSFAFMAQYQQQPVVKDEGIIRSSWLSYYKDLPTEYDEIVQSWDTAIKATDDCDYTVCTSWRITKDMIYLCHVERVRVEYPELKKLIIQQAEAWKPSAILIEDKASGQSVLQDLNKETNLPLIAINPTRDKVTRLIASSSYFEAGKIMLPTLNSKDWAADYVAELLAFPNAKHDDQADSTSQFINWLRLRKQQQNVPRVTGL